MKGLKFLSKSLLFYLLSNPVVLNADSLLGGEATSGSPVTARAETESSPPDPQSENTENTSGQQNKAE